MPKRGGPNRNQGRKPLSPTEPTVTKCVKMPLSLAEKLDRLGGAEWVRQRIDKAREK